MNAWPRMLKRKTAAQYCDLSEAAFEREVVAGRLPAPVMLGGREHSRKPDDQYRKMEALFDGPYAELFSRSGRPGWDVFGNEVGKFDGVLV